MHNQGCLMGGKIESAPILEVAASGVVTEADVRRLRREIFSDHIVAAAEADALFFINNRCEQAGPSWGEFFVEALTDYLVHQAHPQGYVSEENADWLIAKIDHDGHVHAESELELLIKVLEAAQSSPPRLVAYALNQVKHAVITGEGAVRSGKALTPGIVGEAEVETLRRILYAFGGDGSVAITREEAEILFDINDATMESRNDPSWSDLFVKAIANFMMASSGYEVPCREVALRREEWLDARPGVSGFMSQMLAGGLRGIWNAYHAGNGEEMLQERLAHKQAAIAEAETVTSEEAHWLAARIGRDGVVHENEKALLAFIREESPRIHPALKPLIDSAA